MLIGAASARSGASIRAIRLYETLGIIDTPMRQGKYRVYSAQTVEILRCVKQAQRLGFSLKDIVSLRTKEKNGLDQQRFTEAIQYGALQLMVPRHSVDPSKIPGRRVERDQQLRTATG